MNDMNVVGIDTYVRTYIMNRNANHQPTIKNEPIIASCVVVVVVSLQQAPDTTPQSTKEARVGIPTMRSFEFLQRLVGKRKRGRGEIAHHMQPSHTRKLLFPSSPVSAATVFSCLLVASALAHVPVQTRICERHVLHFRKFAQFKASARRISRTRPTSSTQLDATTTKTARSSIALDEIPTHLERDNSQSHVWNIRYSDLIEYKRKHGNTNVPLSYSDTKLAIWVRNQRHQFRHLLNGRRSTLTRERYEKLRAINFDFGTPIREAWGRRYQELVAFKERHGHCNVPELWDENPALGRWVALQRVCYRNLQAETKPDLTLDRVEALEDIGFEWSVHDSSWRNMLERTRRTLFFVDGDDSVPNGDEEEGRLERRPDWTKILGQEHNRDVRVWIDVQRYHYARLQRGDSSSLTHERIEELGRTIPGFQWIGSRGPRQKMTGDEDPLEEDWSRLVEEAKKVDVEAVMVAEKEEDADDLAVWDETDLLDLWAMEDD